MRQSLINSRKEVGVRREEGGGLTKQVRMRVMSPVLGADLDLNSDSKR
jgi:hypothetical protein